MASDRQIAANQRNSKKSSGPRTAEGKASSGRNALRHGLSIPSGMIAAFSPKVTTLARSLSPAGKNFDDAVLIAAEAEVDLLRIRKYRAALIEEACGQGELLSSSLLDQLNRLEPYERRAFARRNKALQATENEGT